MVMPFFKMGSQGVERISWRGETNEMMSSTLTVRARKPVRRLLQMAKWDRMRSWIRAAALVKGKKMLS